MNRLLPLLEMKPPAVFSFLPSRAFVRLVCLVTLLPWGSVSGVDRYQLTPDKALNFTLSSPCQGTAIAIGHAGDLFILLNPGGRVLIYDPLKGVANEFDNGFPIQGRTSDIAADGAFGITVCDPDQSLIARIGRTGATQLPIEFPANQKIEALSSATLTDGRMVILNRQDGDLWMVERNGTASPLLISPRVRTFNYVRLEVPPDEKRVLLLDNNRVRCYRLQGQPVSFPNTSLAVAKGITVSSDGIWIVGDGLEFIPFDLEIARLSFPSDSLAAWRVFPAADIALNNERLFILAENGSKCAQIHLQRVVEVEP